MPLNQSIDSLPGTRSITTDKFKSIGIHTYFDLLNLFPNRYENYTIKSTIDRLQPGEKVTIEGTIVQTKNSYARSGLTIQRVQVQDESGIIDLVWYNQPYLVRNLKEGSQIAVAGEVKQFKQSISLEPAEYEIIKFPEAPRIHTGRIVPIYPEKRGLSTKTIRDKMYYLVNSVLKQNTEELEWLPEFIRKKYKLPCERISYENIHFPSSFLVENAARRRLSFDELFVIQLSTRLIKKEWEQETVGHQFDPKITKGKQVSTFIAELPFKLTNAQQQTIEDVIGDLSKRNPMNRFVQGDVGSGKTVIAATAAYITHLNGYQSLIMAPTEILAQQHYNTITKMLEKYPIKIGIQTGSKKIAKDATSIKEHDIIVGTHALITEKVTYDNVGLVVIDEQHRFGVAQRAILKQKGMNPHLLTMTATPIPRTIALTLYGELDMSVINEMPAGRLPIKTYLTPTHKRDDGYEWIKTQIRKEGIQVFVICPLIEESENETMKSVKAASKEYESLQKIFKEFNVGLLHGKLKSKEKEAVMQDFKDKKYDILVATSVVEVGIDVPNATIMIIEAAERFGLAQLHQLRGRIGRGSKQSYCFLYTEIQGGSDRLQFFARTNKGIELAEYDLKLRGPGNMFGTQQSGFDSLQIANLGDYTLVAQTGEAAGQFIEENKLSEYPDVQKRVDKFRIDQVARD